MIQQVNFLRFVAFFFVFGQHLWPYATDCIPWGAGAFCAVSFFFIASGFCSGFSHSQFGFKHNGFLTEYFYHLVKSVKKIFPLFFVSNAIWFLLHTTYGESSLALFAGKNIYGQEELLKVFVTNMLFLRSWGDWGSACRIFNPVMWFVSTLAFLYVLRTPFLMLLGSIFRRFHGVGLVVAMGLSFAGLIVYTILIVRNGGGAGLLYSYPPARVFEYFMGMSAGMLVQPVSAKLQMKGNSRCKVRWTVIECLTLAIWGGGLFFPILKDWWNVRVIRWIVPNVLLLCVFTCSCGQIVKLCRGHKIFAALGAMVMPCYFFHAEIISILKASVKPVSGSVFSNMVMCLLCAFVTFSIGGMIVEWANKKVKVLVIMLLSLILVLMCGRWLTSYIASAPLKITFSSQDRNLIDNLTYFDLYFTLPQEQVWSGQNKMTVQKSRILDGNLLQARMPEDIRKFWLVLHYDSSYGSYSNLPEIVSASYNGVAIPHDRFKKMISSEHKFSSYIVELP